MLADVEIVSSVNSLFNCILLIIVQQIIQYFPNIVDQLGEIDKLIDRTE